MMNSLLRRNFESQFTVSLLFELLTIESGVRICLRLFMISWQTIVYDGRKTIKSQSLTFTLHLADRHYVYKFGHIFSSNNRIICRVVLGLCIFQPQQRSETARCGATGLPWLTVIPVCIGGSGGQCPDLAPGHMSHHIPRATSAACVMITSLTCPTPI